MPRFDVVWVKSESDHATALTAGLSPLPDDTCATCDAAISPDDHFAVFIDEQGDYWFACDVCVMDLLDPRF